MNIISDYEGDEAVFTKYDERKYSTLQSHHFRDERDYDTIKHIHSNITRLVRIIQFFVDKYSTLFELSSFNILFFLFKFHIH